MACVRQHETNSRWLMELLGQIEHTVNKETDSDNKQVSTAKIVQTWANFNSQILNTRVMHCLHTHKHVCTCAHTFVPILSFTLHHATTIAVQRASPAPEIMDSSRVCVHARACV
jgi:hypothetical protein